MPSAAVFATMRATALFQFNVRVPSAAGRQQCYIQLNSCGRVRGTHLER
jgi:hypothetical protein